MNDIGKELTHSVFLGREYMLRHSPYEKESEFYDSVRSGNVALVKRLMSPLGGNGFGVLSVDPLRNLKYHLVISTAFITRFCVEGGMETEQAYSLSDVYIRKTDLCRSADDINHAHLEMILDFTRRMRDIVRGNLFSKPVLMCFDYIYEHLHEKIQIPSLAEEVSLSVPYLSKLFHNETGMTLTAYIHKKRIEAAENMLKYSDYSYTDIGNYLSFSSHSHFIHVFKKLTGLTPKEYRTKFYHADWTVINSTAD